MTPTADWTLDDDELHIVERSSVTATNELVSAVEEQAWEQLKLPRPMRRAGDEHWTINAGQHVGVARLPVRAGHVALAVAPKLQSDIFFLFDYAYGLADRNAITNLRLRADLASIRSDPTACLLAWFIAELDAFSRRFLRRDYRLQRHVIEGGMRERLLLESYVAGFIATGTPQNVPCEFPDLSLDTAPNQALRATARLALDRCGLLRLPEARSELARRARRVLARFAGVRDTPLHKRTFPTLRRGWPPRRYLPILNRAEAFASGLYADRDIGQHAHQAFMWDMDRLYQEALRGIIAGWGTGRLRSGRPTATICDPHGNRLGQATRVDPDYVLDTPRGTLLLDAKQKDTTATSINDPEVSLPGVDRLKVSRGDVYQLVAYRHHHAYADATVGIVFPIGLEAGQPLPAAHFVDGFEVPVFLLFLDVGANAATNLPTFYDRLDTLCPTTASSLAA